jgi:hypothetical protein
VDFDKKSTCLANGAVSASATTLLFDTLANPGAIKQYDLLQSGDELLRVETVNYNTPAQVDGTLTVTRGAYGTTAAPIADNADLKVKTLEKVRLLDIATKDIENYHQQYVNPPGHWYAGSVQLQRACALQAIYLHKFLAARETAEYVKNVSSGSYSDTVLSISGAARRRLNEDARSLVDFVLGLAKVAVGEFGRA